MWRAIQRSPMVAEYLSADLPQLFILAELYEQYWRTGDVKYAAELRQQRQFFGLTPLDRRRLEWTVQRVEEGAGRKPASSRQRIEAIRGVAASLQPSMSQQGFTGDISNPRLLATWSLGRDLRGEPYRLMTKAALLARAYELYPPATRCRPPTPGELSSRKGRPHVPPPPSPPPRSTAGTRSFNGFKPNGN
jgi:hypothetical protein